MRSQYTTTTFCSRVRGALKRTVPKGAAPLMLQFTISVDLRCAEARLYEELHVEMTKRGFTNLLTSSDHRTVVMPRGHFNFEGDATRDQVLALIRSALKAMKLGAGVVVTQVAARTWSGLDDAARGPDNGQVEDVVP